MRDFSLVDNKVSWLRRWWEENRPFFNRDLYRRKIESYCILVCTRNSQGYYDLGVEVSIEWKNGNSWQGGKLLFSS